MTAAGRRDVMRILLLALAGGVFWGGLFLGLDQGYAAWQSISEPPPQAFADTMVAVVMLLGWLPGAAFSGVIYLLGRIVLQLTGRQENWRRPKAHRRLVRPIRTFCHRWSSTTESLPAGKCNRGICVRG